MMNKVIVVIDKEREERNKKSVIKRCISHNKKVKRLLEELSLAKFGRSLEELTESEEESLRDINTISKVNTHAIELCKKLNQENVKFAAYLEKKHWLNVVCEVEKVPGISDILNRYSIKDGDELDEEVIGSILEFIEDKLNLEEDGDKKLAMSLVYDDFEELLMMLKSNKENDSYNKIVKYVEDLEKELGFTPEF